MIVIGLNSCSHDTSAVLVDSGRVALAVEEERFTGNKHEKGIFLKGKRPENAINWCLNSVGLKKSTTYFAESWRREILSEFCESPLYFIKRAGYSLNYLRSFLSQTNTKTTAVQHHLAHANSTFRISGFKKANILVIDGSGERESTSLYYGDGEDIHRLKSFPKLNSLGLLYREMSELLGMGFFGEGKTMALAAYGKPDPKYSKIVEFDKNNYIVNWKEVKKLKAFTRRKGPILKEHKNIAATLQAKLEEATLKLVEELYELTGNKKLCLAGGVALNCKMNGQILQNSPIKKVFIPFATNDAGAALGAALEVSMQQGCKIKNETPSAYLGPGYTNEEIERELSKHALNYAYYKDIEGIAAELLAKGKIVAWFQGKLEFGPRALGNRSILADPRSSEMTKRVNEIKSREKWRPLAPSILEKKAKKYFENSCPSPFMTLSFQVKKEKRSEVPAIVHVDGSTRPQTLNKKANPRYYTLIRKFEKETGIPLVLNTSFNTRAQPIVRTPRDAIQTFARTGLSYLVMGNYLVKKDT